MKIIILKPKSQDTTESEEKRTVKSSVKNPYWEDDGFQRYTAKNGYHFTDELADFVTKKMVNRDGTLHNWTTAEVREGLGKYAPKRSTYGDLAYSANMAYADFSPLFSDPELMSLRYARLDDEDPDAPESKIFNRWLADAMNSGEKINWNLYV